MHQSMLREVADLFQDASQEQPQRGQLTCRQLALGDPLHLRLSILPDRHAIRLELLRILLPPAALQPPHLQAARSASPEHVRRNAVLPAGMCRCL